MRRGGLQPSLRFAGLAGLILLSAFALTSCAALSFRDSTGGTAGTLPTGGGYEHVGRPYVVAGVTYVPREDPNYSAVGFASWYGAAFHGNYTANGEIYDMNRLTAAHTTLPLPSYVRVTNLQNGASIVVRVNDRGPFHSDRIIDLSARAAELLDMQAAGIAEVQVDYIGRAPLEGDDDRMLMATYQPPHTAGNTTVAYDPVTRTIAARPGWNLFDRLADLAAAAVYQPTALADGIDPLGGILAVQAYAPVPLLTPAVAAAERAAAGTLPETGATVLVQVGVFNDRANANQIAMALTPFGAVTVSEITGASGRLWSVQLTTDAALQRSAIAAAVAGGAAGAYAVNY